MGLPENSKINLNNKYTKGALNKITDVPGVTVGHKTLINNDKDIYTGVTTIFPHQGNIFENKLTAGASVINGFGKSTGIIQIEEMGSIESPIFMTNTFSVGTVLNAATRYMLDQNPAIGAATCTVNCIVTECNDGELSDIRGMHVTEQDVYDSISSACKDFEEGAVGSGTGMCCLGFKGGIGSASRIVKIKDNKYTIGAILMSNFGCSGNLTIEGRKITPPSTEHQKEKDQGSIIIVIATDIPLTSRQLRRVSCRASVSLGKTGSFLGNGSGDIAIAFSTSNILPHFSNSDTVEIKMLHEDCIDTVFEATVEAVEEAIISSLYHAVPFTTTKGKHVHALSEVL